MNKLKPLNKLSNINKSSTYKTKKISIFKSSPKSPSVKPKIVLKTRNYEYGDNWRTFSTDIKQEYGDMCYVCSSRKKVELHHIIPLSKGGKNNRLNTKPLCHKCHSKQHRHMR